MLSTGDDLYPSDVDFEGSRSAPEFQQSMADSLAATKNVHRFDIPSFQKCQLHCNVPQTNNHADPKPLEEMISK